MTLILWGKPNKKQEEFFLSTARHVAYGGARGGGKSWAMRRKFVLLALKYPNLKLLLLRRTLTELRENHTLMLLSELKNAAKYIERERAFIFPNGSRLKLGYCDSETDVLQYQGQEYDVIGLEEATHFTEYQRNFLTTCNRTTRSDFTPRMYYTANPGGVGHGWFKRLFIDRRYKARESKVDYKFIPAKVYDNPILMANNPEYVQNLENLPPELRKAHLDGDWNVFAGQFFPEFSVDKHVVKPFDIPNGWARIRCLDYGMDMTCCLWLAVSGKGEVYVYREFYIEGLTLSQAAKGIVQNESAGKIQYTVASPDLWNNRQETGVSGVSIMAENGLKDLTKARDDRILGWRVLREYLDGKLKIFENCTNLIRTLPLLRYDRIKIEDASSSPHEVTHAPESLRYGIMSLPLIGQKSQFEGFWTETEKMDFAEYNRMRIRRNTK